MIEIAYTNFKPQVWSSALLANFRKNLTALGLASTDYEGALQAGASQVNIIVPGSATVGTYNATNGITWSEVTDSTVNIQLDQQKYVAFKVEDVDQAQSHVNIVQAYVEPHAFALAADMDKYIYGLAQGFTTGVADVTLDLSDPSAATFGADIYEKMLEAAENLDNGDAPRTGRFVVASPRLMRAIAASGDFTPATAMGDAVRVAGTIGRIAGFDVVTSNNVYSTGNGTSTDKVEHLFYGVRGSIGSAVRLSGQPEAVRLPDHFADGVRMLTLYGAKILQPKGLGLIKATVVDAG